MRVFSFMVPQGFEYFAHANAHVDVVGCLAIILQGIANVRQPPQNALTSLGTFI